PLSLPLSLLLLPTSAGEIRLPSAQQRSSPARGGDGAARADDDELEATGGRLAELKVVGSIRSPTTSQGESRWRRSGL
ncbi:unnamed protein product, partial [Urochloa humidicola]